MKPAEQMRGNNHPLFPGPIGNPRAGRARRYSFVGSDGKRQWHTRELAALTASLGGES